MGKLVDRAIEIIKKEGVFKLFNRVFFRLTDHLVDIMRSFYYAIRMKIDSPKGDIQSLAMSVFTKYNGFIRPVQIATEITEFLLLADKIRPRAVIEIGTAKGGTLFLLTRITSNDGVIVSVDLPKSKSNGYPLYKIPLFKSFASSRQKMHLIRADSHQIQTAQMVKDKLPEKQADILFIDGDHTYAGVKKDFELYAPLVHKGGIIALHDIVIHPPEKGCDVHSLWEEVKKNYRYKEIITDINQKGFGIGVLYVD